MVNRFAIPLRYRTLSLRLPINTVDCLLFRIFVEDSLPKLICLERLFTSGRASEIHQRSKNNMQDNIFPSGFVPKVQPGTSTDKYLFGYNVEEFPFLQAKFHRSIWFVNQVWDEFLSPEQTLILTSMEENRYLVGRTPEDEFDRLQELEDVVDIYIPGDRWVIDCEEMNRRDVLKEIERSVEGQKALKRMVDDADLDIVLFPLIPGWEPWHFENCRELFDVFETRCCAFDATEYDSKFLLWKDLEALVETLEPERIYLNGCVSPARLRDVPAEVVAFSGKKSLLDKIQLPSSGHCPALLTEEVNKRVEALNNVQTDLTQF